MSDHHRPKLIAYDLTTSIDEVWTVVAISGEIDMSNAASLEQDLMTATEDAARVELDLRGVTFCDSTGLRSMLTVAVAVRESGRSLRTRASPSVGRLLAITGLEAQLGVADLRDAQREHGRPDQ